MPGETDFLFTTTNIPKLQAFFDTHPKLDISKLRD